MHPIAKVRAKTTLIDGLKARRDAGKFQNVNDAIGLQAAEASRDRMIRDIRSEFRIVGTPRPENGEAP